MSGLGPVVALTREVMYLRLSAKAAWLLRSIDKLSDYAGMVGRWVVLVILVVIVWSTGARYLFARPPVWGYELQTMLWGCVVLLSGLYALRHDGHVRFDVLYRRLSVRRRAIMDSVTWLCFFVFLGAIVSHAVPYGWAAFVRREVLVSLWGAPIWPLKVLTSIVAILLLVQGIAIYIRQVYRAVTGDELS